MIVGDGTHHGYDGAMPSPTRRAEPARVALTIQQAEGGLAQERDQPVQNRGSKLAICADAVIALWDGIGDTISRLLEPAIGREPRQYMDQGGRPAEARGRGYLRRDPERPTTRVWRTEQP